MFLLVLMIPSLEEKLEYGESNEAGTKSNEAGSNNQPPIEVTDTPTPDVLEFTDSFAFEAESRRLATMQYEEAQKAFESDLASQVNLEADF